MCFNQPDLMRNSTYFMSWLIRINSYEVNRAKSYVFHENNNNKTEPCT